MKCGKGASLRSHSFGFGSRCVLQRTTKVSLTPSAIQSRQSRQTALHVSAIAAPLSRPEAVPGPEKQERVFVDRTGKGLAEAPPFSLQDVKNAIPASCYTKDTWRSVSYLIKDVAIVLGLAVGAHTLNQWWAWPAYWLAQGTMFWALFVVGHDCGHGSFSNNKTLNDLIGNITHSSILVPYHGWRISHRTHHQNHGHVENDESWHPVAKHLYQKMDSMSKLGRLTFPTALFAYPFYLWQRSPGKKGAHYDPMCDLFQPNERKLIKTSNKFMQGMVAILVAATLILGPVAMFNLYFMPYWVGVVWLDIVTYLHHHGSEDPAEQIPWYRGEEWSYLRGGLSTLDRDYGIFNKIHHDIGTHVLHHLFPQVPHYNLEEATEAVKPVLGKYYREPLPAQGPLPAQLVEPLIRSFQQDHYVESEGNVVFYKQDPTFPKIQNIFKKD